MYIEELLAEVERENNQQYESPPTAESVGDDDLSGFGFTFESGEADSPDEWE